jgi:type IV secretion system protein VirB3
MRNPCFLALTRPVSIAGLPMTHVMILFMLVVGGFIATLHVAWLPASGLIGYVALRMLANHDPRFLDVILVSLAKTPPPPGWFKGKGMIYRA